MTGRTLDPCAREEQLLAPYAMRARATRGRQYSEPEDPYRTAYQRDRDRIVHSTAFRRLEYKTQVFVNHEGDHYRTRLTHTLEVAQIARGVARNLGLNEDLVEAVALSHDLGHAPFGHAGEEQLDTLMRPWGGFDHNHHCLRVVEQLERRYPDFPGLNLSWEVRESIVKHGGAGSHPARALFDPEAQPLLESQLVDIADSLAYDAHDIDDGLRSGYVQVADFRGLELWRRGEARVRERHGDALEPRLLVARTVSAVIDLQVRDLVDETRRRLLEDRIETLEDVRGARRPLVVFSTGLAQQRAALEALLRERLYRHYRTVRMSEKGKRFIEGVFGEYRRAPDQLPPEYRAQVSDPAGPHPTRVLDRVICDYVAGMTDRFCQQEYSKMFLPHFDGGLGA